MCFCLKYTLNTSRQYMTLYNLASATFPQYGFIPFFNRFMIKCFMIKCMSTHIEKGGNPIDESYKIFC